MLILKIPNIIKSPDNGYWFLWILFLCCFSLWFGIVVCRKFVIKQEYVVLLVEVIILFLIGETVTPWFGIKSLAYYSVYYFAGYIVSKHQLIEKIIVKKRVICLGILFYVVLISTWYRNELPSWLYLFEEELPNLVVRIIKLGFDYVVAFCGILTVWVLVKYFYTKISSRLAMLGKYTLEIYVLHYYFLEMFLIENTAGAVIVNSVAGILLSLMIANCIESGKITNILFGKCIKNNN